MKKMDTIGLKLCEEQAELFESSLTQLEYSSPQFIKMFVYSDVAKRFDNLSAINLIFDVKDALNEITSNNHIKPANKNKFGNNTMYWIGYIYRYWCYVYKVDSISVYKIIKPEELKLLYYPYHTLDPLNAIKRIIEAKGLNNKNSLEYYVNLYRNILNNRK